MRLSFVHAPPARSARSRKVVPDSAVIIASRTSSQTKRSEHPSVIAHGSGLRLVAQPMGASGPWKSRTTRSSVISSAGRLSRYPPAGPRSDRTMPAVRSAGTTCSSTDRGTAVRRAISSSLSERRSPASASASTARVA